MLRNAHILPRFIAMSVPRGIPASKASANAIPETSSETATALKSSGSPVFMSKTAFHKLSIKNSL
jgi:hypothetical protein